ncbi:unnamed protein product [Caenorhabditis brenneri]
MNQSTIPKKQINETGTGYAVEYFDVAPPAGNEVYYAPPAPAKQGKKEEGFVFNFAKGSTPVVNIYQK